jgi:hypothetical protein
MTTFETYSKRQKRLANAGKQDVYQYDVLPPAFRVQVIHIWNDALGQYHGRSIRSPTSEHWDVIHDTLAREVGLPSLPGGYADDPSQRCKEYLTNAATGGALDIIELSFRVIDRGIRGMYGYDLATAFVKLAPDEAIEELNARFREHGIGFQYLGGELVRLDSQFAHAEIVKPALSLLNATGFDGPAEEFLAAFEHYRYGRNKDAVSEALKAFESTMKSICAARKWSHPSNATAVPLIKILLDNGLIPAEMQSHFLSLRSAMESGLPTLSNKTSRHGQGPVPTQVPAHFVGYALHLAASNIIFLVEAHKTLK